jgi:hypothetical protein
MIGNILMIIAIMTTALFFYFMLFTRKDKNRVYIQYVLIAFPFIGIDLLPSLLTISIFDLTNEKMPLKLSIQFLDFTK